MQVSEGRDPTHTPTGKASQAHTRRGVRNDVTSVPVVRGQVVATASICSPHQKLEITRDRLVITYLHTGFEDRISADWGLPALPAVFADASLSQTAQRQEPEARITSPGAFSDGLEVRALGGGG